MEDVRMMCAAVCFSFAKYCPNRIGDRRCDHAMSDTGLCCVNELSYAPADCPLITYEESIKNPHYTVNASCKELHDSKEEIASLKAENVALKTQIESAKKTGVMVIHGDYQTAKAWKQLQTFAASKGVKFFVEGISVYDIMESLVKDGITLKAEVERLRLWCDIYQDLLPTHKVKEAQLIFNLKVNDVIEG